MRKILFASSEVTPLMKTGGLADVSASLPIALDEQGQDVRIVMPAYRATLQQITDAEVVGS
ncbi:MAG: glycogen/starch synthase, partial [Methylophaga sp.]